MIRAYHVAELGYLSNLGKKQKPETKQNNDKKRKKK